MRYLVFILCIIVLSCSKKTSSELPIFSLYYVDNGGNCLPCLQSKQAGKKLLQNHLTSSSYFANTSLQTLHTDNADTEPLRTSCSATPRQLLVVYAEQTSNQAFKRIGTESVVLFPDKADSIIEQWATTILQFADSCETSRGR